MKSMWIGKKEKYDGSQLAPLRSYLKFNLLGDSVISWLGPCDVSVENMLDGEDLIAKEKICSDMMLHFAFEIFGQNLATGVFLQRLFASICKDEIEKQSGVSLLRKGDDLYFKNKKLSISIAAPSVNSVLVHFAMNVTTDGTPVPTCCLEDFKIDAKSLAKILMDKVTKEYVSIKEATMKVRSLI